MPHVEIPQAEVKVVVLGDSHIGKTSLVTRFAEGYYRENSRPATICASLVTRTIQSGDGTPVKVQIWDTAGAEPFRAMAPAFYSRAAAVVVCYDVTRRETFDGMRRWLDEVRRGSKGSDAVLAIAALKTDLLHDAADLAGGIERAVPEYEVEQLAEALGVLYLPTSAKTNHNVHELFRSVADRVLEDRAYALRNGISDDGAPERGASDSKSSAAGGGKDSQYNGGVASDEKADALSPRKRDAFDKYCVSKGDNGTGTPQQANQFGGDDTAPTPMDKSGRKKSRSRSLGKGKGKGARRTSGGGGVPSADSASAATGEGSHPLLAREKSGGKKKSHRRTSECDETLCAEEDAFACGPAACGAADAGGGCAIQ